MPVTDRVQIFFTQTGDRFWTNVFHVNAVTIDAAAAWANTTLATVMTSQLADNFRAVKTLVDHIGDDTFVTTPISIVGGVNGAGYLPLFNTIKVNFSVAGHGRNDYKFVRGWLIESLVEDSQILEGTRTALEAIFDGLITDSAAAGVDLVDSDGNLWLTASVQSAVQMRQLHRRRKKIVTP